MTTFFELLKYGEAELEAVGIDDALFESELILAYSFDISREKILQELNAPINPDSEKKFLKVVARRKKREPLAYIFGYAHFRKHKYLIRKGVLIPRPETELLVEKCIETARVQFGDGAFNVIELGFGAGIIGIELGLEFPNAEVFAWDTSRTAFKVARENAEVLNCSNVRFFNGDFFKAELWENLLRESPNNLIVSNPPYIPDLDVKGLEADVWLYEPKKALKGGKKGLDIYKKLLRIAKNYSPTMLFEIGIDQKLDLEQILADLEYKNYEFENDLQNIPRILSIVPNLQFLGTC